MHHLARMSRLNCHVLIKVQHKPSVLPWWLRQNPTFIVVDFFFSLRAVSFVFPAASVRVKSKVCGKIMQLLALLVIVGRRAGREKQTVLWLLGHSLSQAPPTAVKHPHHPSIVLPLPAQTPCRLHWTERRHTVRPPPTFPLKIAPLRTDANMASTAHMGKPHLWLLYIWILIPVDWPQTFSVSICARTMPRLGNSFLSSVAPIFKLGTSGMNGTLMRHGGV